MPVHRYAWLPRPTRYKLLFLAVVFLLGVSFTVIRAPSSIPTLRGSGVNEAVAGPPTRQQLGHATWTWLHTMAAAYSKQPTVEEQRDMLQLIQLFGKFFPCDECGQHFRYVDNPFSQCTLGKTNLFPGK